MRNHIAQLVAVLVAVFTAGFGFGIVLPVTSVVLEGMSVPTPMIGFTATAMFIGVALGGPLAGRAIELFGLKKTLTGGLFCASLSMGALGAWVSLPPWIALRFILGISFACVFTSCETLINRLCTDENRGKVLGFYAFAFSLSLMLGPIGLWLLKIGIWAPFLAAGIISCAASACVLKSIPHVAEDPSGLSFDLHLVRRIWVSLSTMLMAGFMEGALITLIPIYTLRYGFSPDQTGILLFSFMLGHGGMPPVIGIVGDRVGLKRVLSMTYCLGTVTFAAILFFPHSMALTLMLVLGGASVGALYPLAVGLLPGVLTSAELPRGNAMTTFCYGIGSIVGPFFPAVIMHVTAPKGLFVIAALLYGIVLVTMGSQQRA